MRSSWRYGVTAGLPVWSVTCFVMEKKDRRAAKALRVDHETTCGRVRHHGCVGTILLLKAVSALLDCV